jgi:hypothetical protein
MTVCAYCGKNEGSLTREHLFPRALDQLIVTPANKSHFFSERIPDKFVLAELMVKDVCASCNNVVLSKLDNYLTEWVRKYAMRYFSFGESVVISYDYDKMLRWILKFTFNFARVNPDFSGDADLLKRFRRYILGHAKRPSRMRLSAGLVYSFVPTTKEELTLMGSEPVHPSAIRSSIVATNYKSQYKFSVRRVSLGAFAFLLLVFEPAAPASQINELGMLLDSALPGFRVLKPEDTSRKLTASSESTMDAFRDYAHLQGIPYDSLFKKFHNG